VLHRLGHLDRLQVIGSERRGPCPVHGCDEGHNRSFSANIEKNVFHCFSPGCGAGGNVLDLWAAVHKLPLREAALDLVETFHLDVRAAEKRQPVVPLPQSDRPVATNLATCDNADRVLRPETTKPLPQRC
jgi:DNA primase